MKTYTLYDGRGVFEPENAAILEVFDATDNAAAFASAVSSWPEHGWALYDDAQGDTGLIAWSSPQQKSVTRWFYPWGEPRQYNYAGKRQVRMEKKRRNRI